MTETKLQFDFDPQLHLHMAPDKKSVVKRGPSMVTLFHNAINSVLFLYLVDTRSKLIGTMAVLTLVGIVASLLLLLLA